MADIECLLFLQRFRGAVHDLPTPFLEGLSLFAVTYLVMVPVFVYWAIDKRKGLYTLASYCVCCAFNAVAKLTVCAYRPWIRDPRILPAGDAIRTATGYSFPSGHTATAGPIYGGLAVSAWPRRKGFAAVCLVLLLLTAFSRNYLGVHTPQDVLVALAESALALFAAAKAFAWAERHPEKENLLLLALFAAGWLGLVYITFKPYRTDWVDGKLLVDPARMMNDGYGDLALLIAFPVARFVERKWIRFRPAGGAAGIAVALLGLVPLWWMIARSGAPLNDLLGPHWGRFARKGAIVFHCIALWPAVIKAAGWLAARRTAKGAGGTAGRDPAHGPGRARCNLPARAVYTGRNNPPRKGIEK